ncbi:MAG: phosphoglucosamine mutase [Candidatus Dadabacteria bacterium]|nr:MAG: phosphoglucosamine mutase [Candidatus Dadabacteria bacterium]
MTSSKRQFFGTDGIRGVANDAPMDSLTALRAGQAIGAWFQRTPDRHRIVIGKDTRLSGYMIETAIASGLVSVGCDVYLVGPLPTPGIAFITAGMRADAGVVISASHNPYQYNGIKLFDRYGYKLSDEAELEIERFLVHPEELQPQLATPEAIGKAYRIDDAVGRYVVYLKSAFPREMTLDGVRIVVDCANGATYKVAPEVFSELGADVHPVGVSPNGANINLGVGSTEPDLARQRVVEVGADLGIALDGDGDRLILIDEKGNVVDGDAILAFVGAHLAQRDRLPNRTVVATVASNIGLEFALEPFGARVERTPVGDRYVSARMREVGATFGGESSGHLIFLDYSTTGDGILAALQVLRVMQESGMPLSELAAIMQSVPSVKRNLYVAERRPLDQVDALVELQHRATERLAGRGRILLRYSGTEDLLRVQVEGEDEALIREIADEIEHVALRELGEAAS